MVPNENGWGKRLSHPKLGDRKRKRRNSSDSVYSTNYVQSLEDIAMKSLLKAHPIFRGPWRSPDKYEIWEFWDLVGMDDSNLAKFFFRYILFKNLENTGQAQQLIDISRGVYNKCDFIPYLEHKLIEKDKILEDY